MRSNEVGGAYLERLGGYGSKSRGPCQLGPQDHEQVRSEGPLAGNGFRRALAGSAEPREEVSDMIQCGPLQLHANNLKFAPRLGVGRRSSREVIGGWPGRTP